MKLPRIHTTVLTTLFALGLVGFSWVRAAEEDEDKPVKFTELPAAVAKVIKAAAGDAELKSFVLGDEDGTPAYEAAWNANGHQHEITVTKEGATLGEEEVITLAEAPEKVQTAIAKEAGANKVLEVEKVLEKGKTYYEAEIQQGAGKVEVRFSAKGKVVERENPDAEKEKSEEGAKKEKKG